MQTKTDKRFDQLETKTDLLGAKTNKRFDSIEFKLGMMNESMLRDKISVVRGISYSKPYTIRSLISSVYWASTIQGFDYDAIAQSEKAFKVAQVLAGKVRD